MENTENTQETKLIPKKKTKLKLGKLTTLFEDKKKRYLFMFLFVLPFFVAIFIFGNLAFKEVKGIMDMAKGTTNEVKDENKIVSMNYVLRDNATDIQKECFVELKNAIETEGADEATIAGLVGKNFVADFYTWSNKQGQFDIGGLYYVTDGEYPEDRTNIKSNVFLKARDSFYKYLSNYINDYGAENLLEVESITVTKALKAPFEYVLSEHVGNFQNDEGDWYDYRENKSYPAYEVSCEWTYVNKEKFDSGKYPTKINFIIIERNDRFEIVEMSSSPISSEISTPATPVIEEAENDEDNKEE